MQPNRHESATLSSATTIRTTLTAAIIQLRAKTCGGWGLPQLDTFNPLLLRLRGGPATLALILSALAAEAALTVRQNAFSVHDLLDFINRDSAACTAGTTVTRPLLSTTTVGPFATAKIDFRRFRSHSCALLIYLWITFCFLLKLFSLCQWLPLSRRSVRRADRDELHEDWRGCLNLKWMKQDCSIGGRR